MSTAKSRKPAANKGGKKDLAPTNETLPAFIDANDAGAGMEGTDSESFAIPFLNALQSNSPQCTPKDAKFMEDARQGQLFNTVTNELIDGDEGLLFVPCAFQRRFIRWGARKQGGGYKGDFSPAEVEQMRRNGEVKEVAGKLLFPGPGDVLDVDICDGLKDTRNHFGLMLSPVYGWQRVLLSLASTQIKKSRALMALLEQIKVGGQTTPTFYNKVRITTVGESNDEGSWHGYRIVPEGNLAEEPEVYAEARAFWNLVKEGGAEVQYDSSGDASGEQASQF